MKRKNLIVYIFAVLFSLGMPFLSHAQTPEDDDEECSCGEDEEGACIPCPDEE